MSDEPRKYRKLLVICLLALFIGLIGIVLPEQDNIAFEIIVNNTNLAPAVSGVQGTGERVNDTNYYANNSALQIFLYANSSIGGVADLTFYINDTAVMNLDASSGLINISASALIPKGAKYRTVFSNYHHYEWREYPILSGRNGTLSINITGGGTGSQNLSQVLAQGNDAGNKNIVRLSRLDMNITNGTYSTFTMLGSTSTPFFVAYENGTMRHEITYGGTQIWRLRGSDTIDKSEVGYITYTTPGSNPGIAIFNSSLLNRIDIASTNAGFEFYVYPNASSVRPSAPALIINRSQRIVIPAMSGTGKAYSCVDSNGAFYRGNPGC